MLFRQRQVSYRLILHGVEDYSVIMHEEAKADQPRLDGELKVLVEARPTTKKLNQVQLVFGFFFPML